MTSHTDLNKLLAEIAVNPTLPSIALGLDRVLLSLEKLRNPQLHLPPIVHIAGTNGKGSVLANLKTMLERCEKNVHAYSSPHLVHFNERIVVAGHVAEDAMIIEAINEVKNAIKGFVALTFFEITTLAAILIFSRIPADILLVEVGLGGRLDATNVITPILSIITSISADHKEFLGETLAEIAFEKAGIIKANVPVVIAPQDVDVMHVLTARAHALGAKAEIAGMDWEFTGDNHKIQVSYHNTQYEVSLPKLAGYHQMLNSACAFVAALKIASQLGLDIDALKQAPAYVSWPGRLQKLRYGYLLSLVKENESIWLDGAHNEGAARMLAVWLKNQHKPITLYVGMLANKDLAAFFTAFAGLQPKICTIGFDDAKAASPELLAEIARAQGLKNVVSYRDIESAMRSENVTIAESRDHLICGSLYLAGKILQNHA